MGKEPGFGERVDPEFRVPGRVRDRPLGSGSLRKSGVFQAKFVFQEKVTKYFFHSYYFNISPTRGEFSESKDCININISYFEIFHNKSNDKLIRQKKQLQSVLNPEN